MSVEDCLWWSLAISVIAMDVSKSKVFKRFRLWFLQRNQLLGEMVECPWCLSHWLSLALCVGLWINPLYFLILVGCSSAFILMIGLMFRVVEDLG